MLGALFCSYVELLIHAMFHSVGALLLVSFSKAGKKT